MRAVCVVVKATVVVPAFVVAAAAVKSTSWMVLLSLRGGASQAGEEEAKQFLKKKSWCSLCGKEVSARTLLQGARLRASINQKIHSICAFHLSSRSVATARARASAPLRPASGASEDNLSGCHRPARPFRRAP